MKMRLLLPALFLYATTAVAAPARVDEILREHARHGHVAPELAYAALDAATDRPGPDAPVELRSRFHFALGSYAAGARNHAKTQAAAKALRALASTGRCGPCAAQALIVEGMLAVREKKQSRAKAMLQRVIQAPPRDPATLMSMHLFQANVLDASGQFDEALAAAVQASELAERLDRPSSQLRAMNRMVLSNLGRHDLDRAEALAHEAIAMARRIGDIETEALLHGNLGFVYSVRGKPEKQLESLLEMQRITRAHPELRLPAMIVQVNLADHYHTAGQHGLAIRHAREGERLAKDVGDPVGGAVAMGNRAQSMSELGQREAAIVLLREAIAIAENADAKQYVVSLYGMLTLVLDKAGRTREALQTSYRVNELTTALIQSQREQAVLELQERYSAERKSREIERLSLENARNQAEVNARAWQQRMWAAVAGFLVLGAALLMQWLRRVRRRNRSLEADNAVLAEQSSHDPLTGAFNRRHCQWLMGQQEITLHGRSRDRDYRACVGLILIDVDHFKRVNDVHGHVAGDAVLVEVASRLQGLIREKDALVRWGGEEFVLVLPGTPTEGLRVVADRVLRSIGREPVEVQGAPIAVTASAGCIAWPTYPGQHWEDALHVADLALYLSKSRGRNRATVLAEMQPGANMDRVRSDLAASEAAGEVQLVTVLGPVHDEPAIA